MDRNEHMGHHIMNTPLDQNDFPHKEQSAVGAVDAWLSMPAVYLLLWVLILKIVTSEEATVSPSKTSLVPEETWHNQFVEKY